MGVLFWKFLLKARGEKEQGEGSKGGEKERGGVEGRSKPERGEYEDLFRGVGAKKKGSFSPLSRSWSPKKLGVFGLWILSRS